MLNPSILASQRAGFWPTVRISDCRQPIYISLNPFPLTLWKKRPAIQVLPKPLPRSANEFLQEHQKKRPMQLRIKSQETCLLLMAGLFLGVVVWVRLRLLGLPLERDEGEYAYMAQQLLQGVLPYTEAHSMKFPGIFFVYAGVLVTRPLLIGKPKRRSKNSRDIKAGSSKGVPVYSIGKCQEKMFQL